MTAIPSGKDICNVHDRRSGANYANSWAASKYFTAASSYILTGIAVHGPVVGSPGLITASIRAVDIGTGYPTGPDLAVGTVNTNGWGGGDDWHIVNTISSFPIVAGTKYIVVTHLPSADGSNYFDQDTGFAIENGMHSSDGITWGGGENYERAWQIYGCTAPTIMTDGAININSTSSVLQGTLGLMGDYTLVYVYFEYGLTALYGSTTPEQTFTAASAFAAIISGLVKGTTYHYRAVARYE
jgi:hypothetical protein